MAIRRAMGVAQNPDLSAGTSVGQYTIERRIGAGGMGEVYEAVHTGLGKRVAIKTLRRQYIDNEIVVTRFLREGQVASRIRHPNIVDVTDVGMIDGLPCLVMEYLEGESLHSLLKREGPLEIGRLVDLMLPVMAAVDQAHQHNVVHRDLKPANIFLASGWSDDVVPKVLDFGISKVVQDAPSELTTDSTFLGSPHYVSPELARGDRDIDGRSDQYAIGVILYEGACGVRPFAHRAETFMSLMFAIAQGDFAPPRSHRPELSELFEQIVMRAMSRQRGDRYPNLIQLGRALLPFASPRGRLIWEPVFMGSGGKPSADGRTVPDLPRGPFEESHGTIGTIGSTASSIVTKRPETSPLGTIWWTGAAAAALLVGLGLALGVSKVVTVSKNSEPRGRDVEASGPQNYAVNLKVKPENATIEIDGRKVGVGSYAATFSLESGKHKLRVTAPEHDEKNLEFDALAPPPSTLTLEPSLDVVMPKQKAKPAVVRQPGGTPKEKPGASAAPGEKPPPLKTDRQDPWETP